MNVEIETYNALPCETKMFYINGVSADTDDFGHSEDTDRYNAEPYGCGCRQFISSDDSMAEAMARYGISESEFHEVQDMLESKLYVGSCGCCI